MAAQHRHVRAQAGERGAQLVAGVLHQPLLGVAGAPQGGEHLVERGAQPPGLVAAPDRDGDIEPSGGRDLLGYPGQPGEPARHLAGDEPADARRQGDDQGGGHQGQVPQRIEHALGLGQAAGHLHGAGPVHLAGGEHAVLDPAHRDVAAGGGQGARGHGPIHVVHREHDGRRAADAVTVGGQQLGHVLIAHPRRVDGGVVGVVVPRHRSPATTPAGRPGAVVEGLVDLVVEQVRRGGVAPDADGDGGHRGQQHQGQHQLRPEAHGTRTVYPTPRTVWMSLGSSSISTFRRR